MKPNELEPVINKALRASGLPDASAGLHGFLVLLQKHHIEGYIESLTGGGLEGFTDGLDRITGHHAVSLAESIRNYARALADRCEGAAKIRKSEKGAADWESLVEDAKLLRFVDELLTQLLSNWDPHRKKVELSCFRPDGHLI